MDVSSENICQIGPVRFRFNVQCKRVHSEIVRHVAYLLKARTVASEKQPLLGNDPYTRSRGTREVRCDIKQQ
jgi:hypothetical protein